MSVLLIKNKNNTREEELKQVLKDSFQRLSKAVDLRALEEYKDLLHPSTYNELILHIHSMQKTLISEYARFTGVKEELGLA